MKLEDEPNPEYWMDRALEAEEKLAQLLRHGRRHHDGKERTEEMNGNPKWTTSPRHVNLRLFTLLLAVVILVGGIVVVVLT